MFKFIPTIILLISIFNVSYSITNQQSFISSPLIPSNPTDLTKFLLYISRQRSKDNLKDKLNFLNEKNYNQPKNELILEQKKNEEFQIENTKQEEINSKQENRHHNKHHRDQRRARFDKNIYDSNKTISTDQPQWLPEQTIWRPYYLPRRIINPPFHHNLPRGHNLIPFQGNLNQQMPPPYELFPATNLNPQQSLNSRLSPPNQLPPSIQTSDPRFNPILVDNTGLFNVDLVNNRFINPATGEQINFGNVHSIENLNNIQNQNSNEIEKEQQPTLDKKINDKLKIDNATNSDVQLINSMNTGDPQFVRPNSPLVEFDTSSAQFNEPNNLKLNNAKISSTDPQLFINRIKQTIVTNESFTMQNPKTKPRLEEKSNLLNSLNETTKIQDNNPQQYSPIHFKQTFEQIQAQQKENQRFSQFTPLLYSNQQINGQLNNNGLNGQSIKPTTTKSSLDVVIPQLMNPLTNQQLASSQLNSLINSQQQTPTIQSSTINPLNTPNILKRLQQQQQQQFQNALLARINNHNNNLNSIEAARRMNNNLIQERAIRERNNLNSSPSTLNTSPTSLDLAKNSKEFFTRRTNTHRYVIVSILLTAIAVISIGISIIYIKQRRLNLHNIHNQNINSDITNTYSRRFYQRSSNQTSDSDSYGASYLSNRSITTNTTDSTTGPKLSSLKTSNVIMHR